MLRSLVSIYNHTFYFHPPRIFNQMYAYVLHYINVEMVSVKSESLRRRIKPMYCAFMRGTRVTYTIIIIIIMIIGVPSLRVDFRPPRGERFVLWRFRSSSSSVIKRFALIMLPGRVLLQNVNIILSII